MSDTCSRLDELFAQRWSGRLTNDACAKIDAEIALIQIKAQVRIAESLSKMAEPPMIAASPPFVDWDQGTADKTVVWSAPQDPSRWFLGLAPVISEGQ